VGVLVLLLSSYYDDRKADSVLCYSFGYRNTYASRKPHLDAKVGKGENCRVLQREWEHLLQHVLVQFGIVVSSALVVRQSWIFASNNCALTANLGFCEAST